MRIPLKDGWTLSASVENGKLSLIIENKQEKIFLDFSDTGANGDKIMLQFNTVNNENRLERERNTYKG